MKKTLTLFFLLNMGLSIQAQTFHTIPMDGNPSHWEKVEKFTNCSSADNAFFTWDADYIYFGIKDNDADYDKMATFMYFDINPTANSGSDDAYAWSSNGQNDNIRTPFKADYVIVWKNNNTQQNGDYIEVMKWNKSNNSWDRVASAHSSSLQDGNYVVQFDIGTDYREVKVKRSTFGNPVAIKFCSFTEQQWSNYFRYFAWPDNDWKDQNRGPHQSIPHYYGFILTEHISPNDPPYYDASINGWRGGTNNDWSTASNWSENSVPDGNSLVTIQTGAPVVNTKDDNPATCYDLSVDAAASLTIPAGRAMTISNTFTNHSTTGSNVVVQSDKKYKLNGSLIDKGKTTGKITIQRSINGYTTAKNGWHEIGCPVRSMDIDGSDFAPNNSGYDLYQWDETNNIWNNYKQSNGKHPFSTFTAGQGYLVAYEQTSVKNFQGELVTEPILFEGLSYTSGGWHLLGNPFPSAMRWGGSSWKLYNVESTAKIWNESSGNYTDIHTGDIIPSTNGFFIRVTSKTNSITIPIDDRIHKSSTQNYKSASAETEKQTLRFKVSDDANSYYDVAFIGFKPDATENADLAFDSHKLFSLVNTAPSLWSVTKGQQLSTNYLPETTKPYNVALDFKPGVSSVYHLSVSGLNSFNNPHFVLEDTQTGNMIDLSQQSRYDFSATKGDDIHRFVLHINGVTAIPQQKNNNGIHIFAYRQTVVIEGNKNLNGKVSVFDIMGRKVFTGQLNGTNKQTFRLAQQTGIYFIKVEGTQGVTTKKVFIR